MVARADILAGRAVIVVNIQDTIDKQLRTIRSRLRTFSNSISEIGGDLFRGGIAGTIASVFPVKEFMNFQDQLLFLQTKLQSTDAQLKPLEGTIRKLGQSTSFTSKEVGQAATMFAQAGFNLDEITVSLQSALDLSRGGQVDLSTSTTILSNALRTFQKDASNAADFASKFITAARLGTLDIIDLGESLKYSSGTFSNFSVSIEETLGMLTTLANAGLKATSAGTSLNIMLLNLASEAPKLKELLDLELSDDDLKSPIKALRKIEEQLKRFTKIEQAGILKDIVNIRGGRAIQGLLLQGLDEVEKNIRLVSESTDEARMSAAKLDSRLGGVWRRGLSAFQELGIAIGETSEGPLTKFGERLALILNDLSKFSAENQRLTQGLLIAGPASLVAGAGLLGMTLVLGKLAMFITPIMMLNSVLFDLGARLIGMNSKIFSGIGSNIKAGIFSVIGKQDTKFPTALKAFQESVQKLDQGKAGLQSGFNTSFSAQQALNQKRIIELNRKFGQERISMEKRVQEQLDKVFKTSLLERQKDTEKLHQLRRRDVQIQTEIESFGTKQAQSVKKLDRKPLADLIKERQLTSESIVALEQKQLAKAAEIPIEQTTRQQQKLFQSQAKQRKTLLDKIAVNETTLLARHRKKLATINQRKNALEAPVDASSFLTKERGTGLFAGMRSVFVDIGKIIRRAFTIDFRKLFSGFDIVKTLSSSFKGILTVTKGLFAVLNGVRRVLFSLSGWMLIAEGLILFGDKIPIVKDALEGLGRAFSGAFRNIGTTFKDMSPSFELMGRGIKNIFGGNIDKGLIQVKTAIQDMIEVIRTGLKVAWMDFIDEIQPGVDIIVEGIKGAISVFDALIESIGSVFGGVTKTGEILIRADGNLLETFQSIFSKENMQMFFGGIIAAIGSIASTFNTTIELISRTLWEIKRVFVELLKTASRFVDVDETLGTLDENSAERKALEKERDILISKGRMGRSPEDQARLAEIAALLKNMPRINPFTGTADKANAELLAKLQAIIDNLQSPPPGKKPEDVIGDAVDAAMGAIASNENDKLQQQFEDLTKPIVGAIGEGIADAITGRKLFEQVPAAEQAAKGAAPVLGAVRKALVGTFDQVRGQKLQSLPKMEQLAEKANDILGDIDDGIANLRNDKTPFVFIA